MGEVFEHTNRIGDIFIGIIFVIIGISNVVYIFNLDVEEVNLARKLRKAKLMRELRNLEIDPNTSRR
jgi:hypothetical protein